MRRSVLLSLVLAPLALASALAAGPWDGTCKATADGDKVEAAFVSFRDGAMLNRFGVRQYTASQPLFTLTRRGDAIATTWQSYNRNNIDTAGPPTFRKLAP